MFYFQWCKSSMLNSQVEMSCRLSNIYLDLREKVKTGVKTMCIWHHIILICFYLVTLFYLKIFDLFPKAPLLNV